MGEGSLGKTDILIEERVLYQEVRFAELPITLASRQHTLTDSPTEKTDVAYIEQVVSEEWCTMIKNSPPPLEHRLGF